MWLYLLKYWKYIVPPIAILAVILGIYQYGRVQGKKSVEIRLQKEYTKRIEEYIKQKDLNNRIHEKINRHRSKNPSDKVDTCILSNNPLKSSCLQ